MALMVVLVWRWKEGENYKHLKIRTLLGPVH